jgi:enoyl-CoA hydratase/carnithine racemase
LSYEDIIVERDEGVGIITLNRPRVLNALSRNLYKEVDDAVTELEEDSGVSAIIFTGSGDRAFSAGADIHEMERLSRDPNPPPPDPNRSEYSWHIGACKKPTIGALNGLSYGGGAVFASSLDMRVGCNKSRFRFLAVSYGRLNSSWSLPMQVGWPVAKELLFTGRVVEPEEALKMGLLNYLVEPEEVLPKAMELGKLIAGNYAIMVQAAKQLMIDDVGVPWRQMYENEREMVTSLDVPAVQEGFKEFLDRKGRR